MESERLPKVIPGRKITGISAILLPFTQQGDIDWTGFRAHVERTLAAGLVPAVNMDTGYANLIDEDIRLQVLRETEPLAGNGGYVAGAFVGDEPGARLDIDAYRRGTEQIESYGGIPVIFQSYGLTQQEDQETVAAYHRIASGCSQWIGFELGKMFAPFGKIYSSGVYQELVKIGNCIGAKHSSLSRILEWERLAIRDQLRPDFKVFTGNDLAIDMVIYGSDYLLGLSTFAPDLFATRDRMWQDQDPEFYELNDVLQYLGFFAFRDPVPAYKHDAAMFLKLRGWLECDRTHPNSVARPDYDREVLSGIQAQLDRYC